MIAVPVSTVAKIMFHLPLYIDIMVTRPSHQILRHFLPELFLEQYFYFISKFYSGVYSF